MSNGQMDGERGGADVVDGDRERAAGVAAGVIPPHDIAGGYAAYGTYSGRDWRDDWDLRALLMRIVVADTAGDGLSGTARADCNTSMVILTQRMTHAQAAFAAERGIHAE